MKLRPSLSALLFAVLPGAAVVAQQPSRPDIDPRQIVDPGAGERARGMLDAAARATGAEARKHVDAALALHPGSLEVLTALVVACADDEQLASIAQLRLAEAAATGRGLVKLNRDLRKVVTDKDAVALATARAKAAQAVAQFASRVRGDGGDVGSSATLRWAAALADELVRGMPQAEADLSKQWDKGWERGVPDAAGVLAALGRVLEGNITENPEFSLRAARILRGLANQQRSPDRRGEPGPGTLQLVGRAQQVVAQIRQAQAAARGEPWTVERLRALGDRERVAFTEKHADPANPAVAVSPSGLYLVETVCGFETLLGVAETIEFHHRRLANWYGVDPFDGRQGLVRIVPEQEDMESEGTPFWWAAGFQAGDVTTFRFAVGNIAGLGRGLTHELTHRFDGRLFPFQPSWLTEGKAVWTGAAYVDLDDEQKIERWVARGTMLQTLTMGYGTADNLADLLRGRPRDYRDNYVAGNALFVYLFMGPTPEKPLFRERFVEFLRDARGGRGEPVDYFQSKFCDGQDGRPEDFAEFTKGFADWCRGFRYREPASHVGDFVTRRPESDGGNWGYTTYVYDRPTWSWSRANARPFFGQGHARSAAQLLRDAGDPEGAVAAGLWSLAVDEWTPTEMLAIVEGLRGIGRDQGAWSLQALMHRAFGLGAIDSPSPHRLGRVDQYLDLLQKAARGAVEAGRTKWAAVLIRRHDRVADLLVRARLEVVGASSDLAVGCAADLGVRGWSADWWSGWEDRDRRDLFHVDEAGDLHVGRKKGKVATGLMARGGRATNTYVHSGHWLQPGRYRLTGRVHFTTTWVDGGLVVGAERGDRALQLAFTWGDRPANVRPDKNDSAAFALRSRWLRDGHLSGALFSGRIDLGKRRGTGFPYELLIDGSQLEVRINGELLGRYITPDGSPIEGRVGFVTRAGSFRVQDPRIERLVRAESMRAPFTWGAGLQPEGSSWRERDRLRNRLAMGLPRSQQGVIALWIPGIDYGGRRNDMVIKAADDLGGVFRQLELAQVPVILLPKELPDDLETEIKDVMPGDARIVRHGYGEDDFRRPILVFVDAGGAVRVMREFSYARGTSMSQQLEHWLRAWAPRRR